jgi:hypothetical protein
MLCRDGTHGGHFFYRIPNGELAADAYDQISGEPPWRLFGEADFASVCVLVTHGLMARIFPREVVSFQRRIL